MLNVIFSGFVAFFVWFFVWCPVTALSLTLSIIIC